MKIYLVDKDGNLFKIDLDTFTEESVYYLPKGIVDKSLVDEARVVSD